MAKSSRKAKIVRRTATGAALAVGVALLFLLVERYPPALTAIALALQVAAAIEVDRMGSLAGRRFLEPLLLAACAANAARALALLSGRAFGEPDVLAHALLVGLAAWLARASADFARFARLPRWVAPAAWVTASIGLALAGPERPWVLPVAAVLVLAALALAARGARLAAGAPGAASPRRELAIASGLALWILVPLSLLPSAEVRLGLGGLAALIALSKVGDIAGYFVGSAVGKHHPFPRLSPGKTLEGCLASLAAGALAGGLLAWAGWIDMGFAQGLQCGAILNLAAQAGDLLESRVKRATGVKDSSTWLGAAGGVLDVLDSLLLTLPTALLLWPGGF